VALTAVLGTSIFLAGCASQKYISKRETPFSSLAGPLQLLSGDGPQPSLRTEQLLRRYALDANDPLETLQDLEQEIAREPLPEKLYAYAELAHVQGKRLEAYGNKERALELYGASVAHAYWYLFDGRFDPYRNPYDPQFRGACDVYNGSLEAAMRIIAKKGLLRAGTNCRIATESKVFDIEIAPRGRWQAFDFDQLEFVSDYEVKGLQNRHHTYGLGVPLIAVWRQHQTASERERYYPPGLSFAVTAFLQVKAPPHSLQEDDQRLRHCVLELHDTVALKDIDINGRCIPLETDLTTPLAYFLDNPKFEQQRNIAGPGLWKPDSAATLTGLFMLEPYDPARIPVLMVHGLWSGPVTWMEMFNDLRSFPEIRDQYQFWFYLYPTGQPFWVSARQLRADLAKAHQVLDPQDESPALDQMVLVGHSMGGLVAKMQSVESGNDFWAILSDHPFQELKADDETRERLAQTLFFHPNPSVRRVITIGTPHRGSEFANDYTRWLGRHLIRLPEVMVNTTRAVTRDNPGFFRGTEFLTVNTSIDSLAPESPVLPVLLKASRAPWTRYHNIVGRVSDEGWVGSLAAESDGIVDCESAHLDEIDSEITVSADHVNVHRNPRAILEVRRILLDHRLLARAEIQQSMGIRRLSHETPASQEDVPLAAERGTLEPAASRSH
jgi:pimeloyl-ACP methyl ester carboxylesterase